MKFLKYLFGIIIIASLGCIDSKDCDDPTNIDCSNYDPCYLSTQTSAEFHIFKRWAGSDTVFWFDIADDTLYSSFADWRNVYFKAESPADSFRWKVGLDPTIFVDSSFVLEFPSDAGQINIQLISSQTPDINCFPDDSGMDTVRHSVYFEKISSLEEHPLCCKYRGIIEDRPNDTIVVELKNNLQTLVGLPNICSNGFKIAFGSHSIVGDIKNFACSPSLLGELQADQKTIIINYSFTESGTLVSKRFIGMKE